MITILELLWEDGFIEFLPRELNAKLPYKYIIPSKKAKAIGKKVRWRVLKRLEQERANVDWMEEK